MIDWNMAIIAANITMIFINIISAACNFNPFPDDGNNIGWGIFCLIYGCIWISLILIFHCLIAA